MIDCDMTVNGKTYPLTLTADDYTEHVLLFFANAKAG